MKIILMIVWLLNLGIMVFLGVVFIIRIMTFDIA